MPNQDKHTFIGQQLIDSGFIIEDQLNLALRKQRVDGGRIGTALIELGFIDDTVLADTLARSSHTEFISIKEEGVDPEAISLVSYNTASKHEVIPIKIQDHVLIVASSDPANLNAIDALRRETSLRVKLVAASLKEIRFMTELHYAHEDMLEKTIDEIMMHDNFASIDSGDSTPPVVRLVDQLIAYGVRVNATDIHFEPEDKLMRIRVRVDGSLRAVALLPAAVGPPLSARIKILANLNPSDRREPQDGSLSHITGYSNYEIRVSVLPTGTHNGGESIVLRLLNQDMMNKTIDHLDMPDSVLKGVRERLALPHGMVLVTGPTGSGKTTTLYSCMNEIDISRIAVFTVEDPVESPRSGITQVSANADIGMSFSKALREILRQDPDVIMIGEVRDSETAEIAIRSSLTGHLVLSSLHTNNAIETVYRLADMGIEPYLIATVLKGALAQRLVKRVCPECSSPRDTPLPEFAQDIEGNFLQANHSGCDKCNGGYKGRVGLFEFLDVDSEIRAMIMENTPVDEFESRAREKGFRSMLDDGLLKAARGITTIEEVISVSEAF